MIQSSASPASNGSEARKDTSSLSDGPTGFALRFAEGLLPEAGVLGVRPLPGEDAFVECPPLDEAAFAVRPLPVADVFVPPPDERFDADCLVFALPAAAAFFSVPESFFSPLEAKHVPPHL